MDRYLLAAVSDTLQSFNFAIGAPEEINLGTDNLSFYFHISN